MPPRQKIRRNTRELIIVSDVRQKSISRRIPLISQLLQLASRHLQSLIDFNHQEETPTLRNPLRVRNLVSKN